MNKRKSIIVSIIIVLLIVVLVTGATYAYLTSITNEEQVDTGSGMLGIDYDAPDDITTGILNASSDRSKGLHSVATASLESGSEQALFNMYITPTTLSDNLKIEAFKWEVVVDGVVIKHGDFENADIGVPIKVVDSYKLTTATTTFNIYVWLDASLVSTSISSASFSASIGADSVPITGSF